MDMSGQVKLPKLVRAEDGLKKECAFVRETARRVCTVTCVKGASTTFVKT